jgi:hypothetical protein
MPSRWNGRPDDSPRGIDASGGTTISTSHLERIWNMIDRNRRKDLTVRYRHKDSGIRVANHVATRSDRRATNVMLSTFPWDALDALVESL